MKNFDIFIWACDYEDFTGEGLLARCFVENYFLDKNLRIKIVSNNGSYLYNKNKIFIIRKKKYKNNIFKKYFYFIFGILIIWYYHTKGKKVCYLNYLPLWNFLIFFLIPKNTILGPITGSIYIQKIYSINTLVRKLLFPFLYKISLNIIFFRFKNIIFSTNNLQSIVKKDKIKYCLFNFCFLFFKERKRKRKSIDFLFYIRKHALKSNHFHKSIIKKLVTLGLRIVVVGDKFSYLNVTNYINISRSKLLTILDKTKYTIASDENFYSLFTLDCLSSNLIIFYNKNTQKNADYISNFIPIEFKNYYNSEKKIKNFILKNKKIIFQKSPNTFFNNSKIKIKNRIELIRRDLL